MRCHVTSEKSSKNCISLFEESLPEGYPRHPPHLSASHYRTFSTCWTASADRKCDFYLWESLSVGGGGRAGWFAKRCLSITDHRIDCQLKTKIANSILLLCYLNNILKNCFIVELFEKWPNYPPLLPPSSPCLVLLNYMTSGLCRGSCFFGYTAENSLTARIISKDPLF